MQHIDRRKDDPFTSRRAAIRADVEISAEIRQFGYSYFKTRLVDISQLGFRVEHPFKFNLGTRVNLRIPGLEALEAEIKWIEGNQYGAMFIAPLHPAVFDHVIQYVNGKQRKAAC